MIARIHIAPCRADAPIHRMSSIASSPTRRWLKLGLISSGFLAGAVFGVVLTPLGKIVADAPPATLANYIRNAVTLGALAAVISPIVSWSALRHVPLWRTIVEPLAFAIAGGAAAAIAGVPLLLIVLPAAGLTLGFIRLQRRYPNHRLPSTQPISKR